MFAWFLRPLTATTEPTPQASVSYSGSYKPCAGGSWLAGGPHEAKARADGGWSRRRRARPSSWAALGFMGRPRDMSTRRARLRHRTVPCALPDGDSPDPFQAAMPTGVVAAATDQPNGSDRSCQHAIGQIGRANV